MNKRQFESAASTAKLTALPGRWARVGSDGHLVGKFESLGHQNGFWSFNRESFTRVFVVTTGPLKGIWGAVEHN